MLAGGIGFGKKSESNKLKPGKNDPVILLGGDNYRIGMGGGAVSSVATGEYGNSIELNAVQRANPEMQKRVYNAIRAMTEDDNNPIISVHDHGAGGHLNCFSEIVEEEGGTINLDKLPIGDPTLSAKEIIGNESQERMGLVISSDKTGYLQKVAERERSPFYEVGRITGDHKLVFSDGKSGDRPIDLEINSLFGNPPRTIMNDISVETVYKDALYDPSDFKKYLESLLQLEAVGCKDWLTNKVDRSVTGKVAKQQTSGKLQLPMNNLAVVTMDYRGPGGIATSIGHASVPGLANPVTGSILSVAEALTNIIWAPLTHGIEGISLSANWMWPCRNEGEDARLYEAVKGISDFAIELGINIPTGKDSLSMTQKYPDGSAVISPGTVIVSATAEVSDIREVVEPSARHIPGSKIIYIDFSLDEFHLGGSSFYQLFGEIGREVPTVKDSGYFRKAFEAVQILIKEGLVVSGHDISSGGMITSLLEMTFSDNETGFDMELSGFNEQDALRILFSEKPGIIIQVEDEARIKTILDAKGIEFKNLGRTTSDNTLKIRHGKFEVMLEKKIFRDYWYKTSYLLDRHQSKHGHAELRFTNYKEQPLNIIFPANFKGTFTQYGVDPDRRKKSGLKAAIIREKGVNGDREMAWSMYLAGFDVKDVHMTDLISGRETLEDINFITFVGGFSNSDVLGSAKGWAGAFLYNPEAKDVLDRYYRRNDTISLGVCNGCQLMVELGLIYPEMDEKPSMKINSSGKFESAFITMDILPNNSIMLKSLAGSRLGAWVAHGEGRFDLALDETKYHIPAKFHYDKFPGNPNGSAYRAACIASVDGRHLAIMPHLERSLYPWNWGYYPESRKNDEVSPWIEAFVNARNWVKDHCK
jgi:phosphoribosylformylglycinamidine synthase